MTEYTKPQPPPEASDSPPMWPLVAADFARYADAPGISEESRIACRAMVEDAMHRDAFGREKHGTPLTRDNGRDAAVDAYQEALDGCVYWRQEYERTKDQEVVSLYGDATTLAVRARRYLLRRDGK